DQQVSSNRRSAGWLLRCLRPKRLPNRLSEAVVAGDGADEMLEVFGAKEFAHRAVCLDDFEVDLRLCKLVVRLVANGGNDELRYARRPAGRRDHQPSCADLRQQSVQL